MRTLKALAAAAIALSLLPAIPAASGREASRQSRKPLPALTGVKPDALTRALDSGELSEAEYALERAKSLFTLRAARREYGDVARTSGRDATLILRDLAIRKRFLSGAARSEADAIAARPDDNAGEPFPGVDAYNNGATVDVLCAPDPVQVCVHYVAPGNGDADNAATNAFAASTLAEMVTVWNTEIVEQGFRAPKSDATSDNDGGDARTDVYLLNIGAAGLYGYCYTDDPEIEKSNGKHDISSYCVLDNDYSSEEFPHLGPLENMQVTAAHEFFHAVQFAYDAYDDSWFLEGTAVWMEDEVYDAVNDNYQYLNTSIAMQPQKAIDFTNNGGAFLNRYGSWYFFRYISELFSPTPQVTDPSLIREMWEQADARAGAPDEYSMEAVASVISDNGDNITDLYADFAATAFVPETFFEEGADYISYLAINGSTNDGRPPLSLNKTVTTAAPSANKTVELDHLSSRYFSFAPGSVPGTSLLKLKVNGPARSRGTRATAVVMNSDGTADITPFTINSDGDGTQTVPFDPATVDRVILVASNASTKYKNCGGFTFYACSGTPKFENQKFVVKGTLK
jgi:hypothetical protein